MKKRKILDGSIKNLYTRTLVSVCLSSIDDDTILTEQHLTDALDCADKKVDEFNDNIKNGKEHSPELDCIFNQATKHIKSLTV